MNCLECQELLQRRLDGDNVPGSLELDQHLASCRGCRLSHSAAHNVLDAVRQSPRPQLAAGFTDRMVATVLYDRAQRQRRSRKRWRTITAMAAAILLMACAGYLFLPNQPAEHKTIVENPPRQAEERPLAQSVDDARHAVAALTDRIADQTKDQARLLIAAAPHEVPMADLPKLPSLEDPLDPATQSFRQAGQGLSQGIGTLTHNARRAVN